MNKRRFFFQLGLVSVSIAVVLLLLQIFPPLKACRDFSFFSLLFFVVISSCMYFLAAKAAISKDKNAFTRLIMVFTFAKMVLTAILVITYHRLFKPADNFFLLPFFSIYIVYTIFETIFLTHLGKIKAR